MGLGRIVTLQSIATHSLRKMRGQHLYQAQESISQPPPQTVRRPPPRHMTPTTFRTLRNTKQICCTDILTTLLKRKKASQMTERSRKAVCQNQGRWGLAYLTRSITQIRVT